MMSTVSILWDESHIWGLLAWRAIDALGLPYRLVRAQDIAQGALSRKFSGALVVPGGVARRKAEKLGEGGMRAVREYVAGGGAYMGFCGGSGLGLTGKYGLSLCPWKRMMMADRMLHLISGHLYVQGLPGHALTPGDLPEAPLAPVWWPARFAAELNTSVTVLATYQSPGPDFWVADLPFNTLPEGTFSAWEKQYDVRLRPSSLYGQPCIITGDMGKGRYVLSYSHLETPDSPHANAWLAHILGEFLGERAPVALAPRWELSEMPVLWDAPALEETRETMDDILALGREHFLLFQRNCWLQGWRAGLPGAALNNLNTLIKQIMATAPTARAEAYLNEHAAELTQAAKEFRAQTMGYLLAERLAMTLAKTFPDAVSQKKLIEQRTAIFGQAMEQGGLYARILERLDELAWLVLSGEG